MEKRSCALHAFAALASSGAVRLRSLLVASAWLFACALAACSPLALYDAKILLHMRVLTFQTFQPAARANSSAPRGVAQAIASRESPAGQGTPCTAGDRRLARRVPRPPAACRHASRRRAPEERPAAGRLYYIYLYLTRSAPCASRFALRASRRCASRCALRAARFALLRFPRS